MPVGLNDPVPPCIPTTIHVDGGVISPFMVLVAVTTVAWLFAANDTVFKSDVVANAFVDVAMTMVFAVVELTLKLTVALTRVDVAVGLWIAQTVVVAAVGVIRAAVVRMPPLTNPFVAEIIV